MSTVLDMKGARELLGKLKKPDGKPVGRKTIYRWRRDHGLPHRNDTGRISFIADELTKWVESGKRGQR